MKDFFEFVQERRNIQLRKDAGQKWPWTSNRYLRDTRVPCVLWGDQPSTKWMIKNVYSTANAKHVPFLAYACRAFDVPQMFHAVKESVPYTAERAASLEKIAADLLESGTWPFRHGMNSSIGRKPMEWHIAHVVLPSVWKRTSNMIAGREKLARVLMSCGGENETILYALSDVTSTLYTEDYEVLPVPRQSLRAMRKMSVSKHYRKDRIDVLMNEQSYHLRGVRLSKLDMVRMTIEYDKYLQTIKGARVRTEKYV